MFVQTALGLNMLQTVRGQGWQSIIAIHIIQSTIAAIVMADIFNTHVTWGSECLIYDRKHKTFRLHVLLCSLNKENYY